VRLWHAASDPEVDNPGRLARPDRVRTALARALVDRRFDLLVFKEDVLQSLRDDPSLGAELRDEALQQAAARSVDQATLRARAWEIVSVPGRSAEEYRKALRMSETATAGKTTVTLSDWPYLYTLGASQYRVGAYREALAALDRCAPAVERIKAQESVAVPWRRNLVATLALRAMTLHRLGRAEDARAVLRGLRALLQERKWPNDKISSDLLHEAESTVQFGAL
jgi:hypothetical protein